ncbi:hypothetical protein D3C87_467160 [compost metagenome]
MVDDLKIFISKIDKFNTLKASEKIDFFAHFLVYELKKEYFTSADIKRIFDILRLLPYSNINKYLNDNSNQAKTKKNKIKFIKNKNGYHFVSSFEAELLTNIKDKDEPFINFKINSDELEWKPSNIPFLNSKIKKNADFFSKLYYLLYHLENSIRKFLTIRLNSILGGSWDSILVSNVDLSKAQSIRRETKLSEMLQDRGDSILYYCMWDDYGKIIRNYPEILPNVKYSDEILAHLSSLAKIRNAIAHNTATIPQEYQDELTLFIKKYIKMMKNQNI